MQILDHNLKAYKALIKSFKKANRACIVHPTGLGKSYIAYQLIADNPDSTFLVLTSLKKIEEKWREELREEGIVGDEKSEGRVKKKDDEWEGRIEEENRAGIEESKEENRAENKEENRTGIKIKGGKGKVHTDIYMNLNSEAYHNLDYIILDEFHRCGAREWSKQISLLLSNNPQAKVLGLSATPVRSLDGNRDMSQELFYGNVAHEISLKKAIRDGLLAAPEYYAAVYSFKADIEKLESRLRGRKNVRAERLIQQAKNCMENSDGLKEMFSTYMREDGKYLAFCTSQEHLTKMMEGAKEWFPEGTRLYKYYANLRSSKEYDDFICDNDKGIKVLFSIEMLNEGIHNPDVDGCIMFRPTESHIIYLQQLGRVLHVNGAKKPQVFDIVNNAASLTVLESEIKQRNGTKKKPGENDISFIITPKQRDIMHIISDIKAALEDPWEYRYTECLEYGTNVRYKDNEGLYRWLHAQRILYANGMLEQRKIDALEKLGMDWKINQTIWDNEYRLGRAKEYTEKEGHLRVPASYECDDGFPLGAWIESLRRSYKNGSLSEEMIEALDKLGMVWSFKDMEVPAKWLESYEMLKLYREEYGNVLVPQSYVIDDYKLGIWVSNQRSGELNEKQVELLDEIGFVWDVQEYTWNDKFNRAKAGDESREVLTWKNMQQTLLNQGKLSAERAKKIRELGIRSKDDVWFENYEVVKEQLKNGAKLDAKHKRWLQRQKKADISEDKRELIEKLMNGSSSV